VLSEPPFRGSIGPVWVREGVPNFMTVRISHGQQACSSSKKSKFADARWAKTRILNSRWGGCVDISREVEARVFVLKYVRNRVSVFNDTCVCSSPGTVCRNGWSCTVPPCQEGNQPAPLLRVLSHDARASPAHTHISIARIGMTRRQRTWMMRYKPFLMRDPKCSGACMCQLCIK
jgi:hypothetical protein